MASQYKQNTNYSGVTRFTEAPMAGLEFSKMTADPSWYFTFNGGDITPCYYSEVLPHDTFELDLDYVVRLLSTALRPTMGKMQLDVYAFFVPNRVINESWKNVQGENTSGYWNAPAVNLAPLYDSGSNAISGSTTFPVGSLADHYGFPTQAPIPNVILNQCNDLKFRGYVEIYNQYFRDQNYMSPVPYSKLNIYNDFISGGSPVISFNTSGNALSSDGSYPRGAIGKAIGGEGSRADVLSNFSLELRNSSNSGRLSIKNAPLKACKLHDAFTSVLPAPQKGSSVAFSVFNAPLPVNFSLVDTAYPISPNTSGSTVRGLQLYFDKSLSIGHGALEVYANQAGRTAGVVKGSNESGPPATLDMPVGWNIKGEVPLTSGVGLSVDALRTAISTQQVLELLARGGSRYWEFLKTFFGVEVDDPFPDIPTQIGHISRELDLYQVAQTSATQEGSTTQGSLTAFGYTAKGGALFTKSFREHGYIHCLCVVRHRNLYSTYFAPDNFRKTTMDFYLPQLANISEQPIRAAILNPFDSLNMSRAIGYQEAWWEYRYEPDQVHGALRSGISQSLDVWHYGDPFSSTFNVVDNNWLRSNTQEVLDRTLAVTSAVSPQFIAQFNWKVTKQRPMPVYSVPGLDTI